MDPLSMTASIIAILQLTSTLANYINETRNATAEQKKVAVEASNLYALLTNLRFQVDEPQSNDPWFNQVKLLGVPNGPLDQFKGVLESMVKQLSTSRKRDQVKSALLWKFTKKEVEDALARIERLKTLISCALTKDLLTLSRAIHDDLETVREQNAQLSTRIDRLQTLADQELQNKLSQWLNIPDPSTNYQAALLKRNPETGQWLLDGQHFIDWKSSTSSLMWLHGSAGCGKTILSASSLHNILQHKESHPDTIVSYFYFDFNDAAKQSSRKAVRSLLFQAALQATDILHDLERLYQKCSGGQQQPAEDTIHSLFRDAMARPGMKYIILDGLDECTDREVLLPFIREVATSKLRDLHIMATSRREKDIEEELSPVADHSINIQSAIVDEDIRAYIRYRMATDTTLKKWRDSVRNEIMTALMEKAGGMFRWVFCQLESIRQCTHLKMLRKALLSLPTTLDDTYVRILDNLELAGQLENAVKALQWLCFSNRPLRLTEMIEILAIETGDQGGFDPEERLPDPMDVMVVCSSLISFNPIGRGIYSGKHSDENHAVSFNESGKDADRIQIQLAHFSVKEFLLSDRCAFSQSFRSQVCHSIIAESCLRYLLHLGQNGPLTHELVRQYPLSVYAAKQWWQYLQAISCMIDETLLELTLWFLTEEDASLLPWVQLYDMDKPWRGVDPSIKGEDVAQPLYYAANIGVPAVVKKILERNIDVNAYGGRYGTALQVASFRGHETVVKMLLEAGTNVNAQGGYYGTTLQAASYGGSKTLVKMALEAGEDVNAQGVHFGTALQAASYRGHETVVKMLLEAGADVNAQGGEDCTALQMASHQGHETVVKMLLEAGADVNMQGPYGTVLQAASYRGHETVVKMLLEAGADVNVQGPHGTALQAASYGGSETVVKMLLEAGEDVNAQGGEDGTALQAASRRGYETVVKMLLEAGADVTAHGGEYGTALQVASLRGYETVVKMLLEAGADVTAQGGEYGTALQAASGGGYETVVKMLLEAGADVNMQGPYGTVLQAASYRGHETVVKMLLEAGADVNVQGPHGTALQAASYGGSETVVKMLLEAGADVNAQGKEYGQCA